jgi:hypothetical protein
LEYVSADAEGFYCHFLPEIFNQSVLKIDFENDFPFFQFTGEPLLKVSDHERFVQLFHILENENYKNREERFGLIPFVGGKTPIGACCAKDKKCFGAAYATLQKCPFTMGLREKDGG